MKSYTDIMQGEERISGVLLHPTSLPSGQIDNDAFRWLDFMSQAGLNVWQVLPLGVPQSNRSPYQCYSAFALNPALLECMPQNGHEQEIRNDPAFRLWYQQEHYWLDDYALYMSLKQEHSNSAWFDWPDLHKTRNKEALEKFRQNHLNEIFAVYWQQYQLDRQWSAIRQYAVERDIYLFGDMPIFVAHDSVDVWANQDYFLLDDNGMPTVVAGVPPDYFSKTGQRWGNPHYDWDTMLDNGFDWWLNRLKNHFQHFDLVRIDHFRGLDAVWSVDASEETAINGEWVKVPGDELLQHLLEELGHVPLVAEDLGIITPEVNALREKFNLPGMSVLQFSFDEFPDNPHKPRNINHDRVVYTGTHDNDTTVGWYNSLDPQTRQYVSRKIGTRLKQAEADATKVQHSLLDEHVGSNGMDAGEVAGQLISMALQSAAQLAVIPLQDFLKLGSDARMNIPGTMDNNWQWQFDWSQMPTNLAEQIRQSISESGRLITTGDD